MTRDEYIAILEKAGLSPCQCPSYYDKTTMPPCPVHAPEEWKAEYERGER